MNDLFIVFGVWNFWLSASQFIVIAQLINFEMEIKRDSHFVEWQKRFNVRSKQY